MVENLIMSRVIHFEIPVQDPENSMNFYNQVFGWTFDQFGKEQYWLAKTGEESTPGINGAIMKRNHPEQPVTNNILVKNLDETIRLIEKLGGTIVVKKMEIPGVGHLAFFKDPDEHIFGIMEQ